MKTVADLLAKWPTDAEFGRDIRISSARVSMWKQRNSLPSRYWGAIIISARQRKIKGVTYDSLGQIVINRLRASA